MLRLNPTVIKLTMSEVKDLDNRRRFHNYLKVEDSATRLTKAREKQPEVPSIHVEPSPAEPSPRGADLPDGSPSGHPSAGSAPDTHSVTLPASQPLGCDGLDEGHVEVAETHGRRDPRGLESLELLSQPDSSPCPAAPGPSSSRNHEIPRDRLPLPASPKHKRTGSVDHQHSALGFGLRDLVYSADWGSSSSSPPARTSRVRSTAPPAIVVGREAGVGTGGDMGATSDEGERRPFVRVVPATPARLRVYNDSLPAATQPRTPQHLPEARHQSRLLGAFTAPIRRAQPASTAPSDTLGMPRLRRQEREGRAMSPPWLRRGRFGALREGIENADASIVDEGTSRDMD